MPTSRRQLLQTLGASTLLAGAPAAASKGPKNLVVVVAKGGWDTTYCIDPKPGSPFVDGPDRANPEGESLQIAQNIPYWSNPALRPDVDTFFARWGHLVAVVNGIWMGSIVHNACMNAILCGSRRGDRPDLTVIHGHVHGRDLPLGNLDLSGLSRPGSLGHETGRVGFRQQLRMLLDDEQEFAGLDPDRFRPGPADRDDVGAYLSRRFDAYRRARAVGPEQQAQVDILAHSSRRARHLREERDAILPSLTLGSSPGLVQHIGLSLNALRRGLTRSILFEDSQTGWDSHPDNASQHPLWNTLLRRMGELLQGLVDHDLLDETLVVVTSEMTRTPLLNAKGGKDHWPYTSALVFGGGVRGGRVLGATDDSTAALPVDFRTGAPDPLGRPCQYDNFAAGLLEILEIDPAEWLPGTDVYRALSS